MLRAKCLHGRDWHVMVRAEWSHQVLAGEMFEGRGEGRNEEVIPSAGQDIPCSAAKRLELGLSGSCHLCDAF